VLIQVNFAGEISLVDANITSPDRPVVGDLFSRSLFYDTATPATVDPAMPSTALYSNAFTSFTISSPTLSWQSSSGGITVGNRVDLDSFFEANPVLCSATAPLCGDSITNFVNDFSFADSGSSLGSFAPSIIGFAFNDFTLFPNQPDWLSDTSLPLAVRTSDLILSEVRISLFSQTDGSADIGGLITSVSSRVVPLPPAIWLFGTALIGFVGMSRRRKVA
jgi:hypothetical protein